MKPDVQPPLSPIEPQLGDVQETLLIPLYFRAKETARADAIVRDPRAVAIVNSLNYDFSRFDDAQYVGLDCIIRSEVFDEQVKSFVDQFPDGIIINLGAGLDARFWRVDNGRIRWFDLDMPDAIALRQRFLPDGERHRSIPLSMFDTQWMDWVDAPPSTPILVVAEGLFCYFSESQIRPLLAMISERWPGTRVVFQSISPSYVSQEQNIPAVKQTRAKFLWGIVSGKELESWHSEYQFLGEWYLIDRHRARWGWLRYRTWLPWVREDLRRVMKISLVQLGKR